MATADSAELLPSLRGALRAEAIQKALKKELDCFAPLAMTLDQCVWNLKALIQAPVVYAKPHS